MKKCPFCAEEIQDAAIKCKHCGEFIKKIKKWYFEPIGMVILFLVIGPLALPVVWMNPDLDKRIKIIISALVIVLFLAVWNLAANSMKNIISYYQLMFSL